MKYMKLWSVITLLALVSTAGAHSSFNLFLGPQPVYVPAPLPVSVAPSVGFSMGIPLGDPCDGAPTVGFSMNVPLGSPVLYCPRPRVAQHMVESIYVVDTVCRDDEDRRYWRIYNDTDTSIKVMSNSETKIIEPGESRKLDHSSSFSLRVTDGDQKIKVKTHSHTLSIQFDHSGALKIHRM